VLLDGVVVFFGWDFDVLSFCVEVFAGVVEPHALKVSAEREASVATVMSLREGNTV